MDSKSMEEPPDLSQFLSIYICEGENSLPVIPKEKDEGVSVQDFLKGLTETTITPILNEESSNSKGSKFSEMFDCIVSSNREYCELCKKYFSKAKFHAHTKTHPEERPFSCNVCNKTYSRADKLNRHRLTHVSTPHTCICGRYFAQLNNLKTHLKTHKAFSDAFKKKIVECSKTRFEKNVEKSVFKGPLLCPYCKLDFPGEYKLSRHIRTHTGDKPFECPCGVKFTRKEHLKKHRLCKSCPFNATGQISESERSTGKDNEPTNEVVEQIKEITKQNMNELDSLNEFSTDAVKNEFLEQPMDAEQSQKVMLNETWKKFAKNLKIHVCEYCNKVFTKNHKLNIHRRIHTGEKPFCCETCGKGFSRKDHLLKHQNVHLKYRNLTNRSFLHPLITDQNNVNSTQFQDMDFKEEKSDDYPQMAETEDAIENITISCVAPPPEDKLHYCPICNHGFKKYSNFQSHLETHGERETFKCPICSREFRVKKNFEAHLLNHETTLTMESLSPETTITNSYIELAKAKRVQCPTCMKWLVSQSSLLMHMRSHTGEKPHKCDTCDRYFVRKADMMRHRRRHTGENLFPCSLCDVTYTRRDKLAAHVRKNHAYFTADTS